MKLEKLLDNIEDFELAFLLRFRFPGLKEENQRRILEEVIKRNFTDEYIAKLIQEKEAQKPSKEFLECPRCRSQKFFSDEKSENMSVEVEGKKIPSALYTCLICGHSVQLVVNK